MYNIFIILACGYVVFWKSANPAWFLVGVLLITIYAAFGIDRDYDNDYDKEDKDEPTAG